ncbi:nuclear transport factor 2 family protein [Burkholderia perseverans]|uniref:nuclear transport factor 2 family protein n=1 Tax=Burkholderia perseverans TaxID=2615214 RepID=UPI001FEFE503|nr:nuclear transport factor 2 family protein [Burkholderia perseverans]
MRAQDNVQVVKDFFAAMARGDRQDALAPCAEDIEWIIPGEGWPLAGSHRGHAGLRDLLQQASETVETDYRGSLEFVAQGERVLMIGSAGGRSQATDRFPASAPPSPHNPKKCLGPEGSGAEANRVSITLFGERVRSTV